MPQLRTAVSTSAGPGGATLAVRRVYFTLHHLLKELSSKRLLADQKCFAEVRLMRTFHRI